MHGFSGYFDSQLYGTASISIHPETHSDGMFSWFPMYIPLIHPLEVKADDVIVAHFWRKADRSKVGIDRGMAG
jgi:protein arginine N-methyltransferase 5